MKRDRGSWLPFLLTILLSGLFGFADLSEYVTVGILNDTAGYPFGGEGPVSWHYKSQSLYTSVCLIVGPLFISAFLVSVWAFFKNKKKLLLVTFMATSVLIALHLLLSTQS